MTRRKLCVNRAGVAAYSWVATIAVVLGFTSSALADSVLYTITDLGGFAQFDTIAYGINNHGQVVGYSKFFSGDDGGFLWSNGTLTNLGNLGGNQTTAYEINDSGQVVGYSNIAGNHPRAFLWQNGSMTNLGTLGGDASYAYGINNSGQSVGDSEVVPGGSYEQAFIMQSGTMQKLTAATGTRTQATAINDLGETVGSASSSPDGGEACIWQGASRTPLGVLANDASSFAMDINNARQVVGNSGSQSRAFIWQNGVMSALPTLGGTRGTARAINAAGIVVGNSQRANGQFTAAIWESGQVYDLNSLISPSSGWVLGQAQDINDLGQIIAIGYYQGGLFTRSVLLTPVSLVPEPSGLCILLVSSIVAASIHRKRRVSY